MIDNITYITISMNTNNHLIVNHDGTIKLSTIDVMGMNSIFKKFNACNWNIKNPINQESYKLFDSDSCIA